MAVMMNTLNVHRGFVRLSQIFATVFVQTGWGRKKKEIYHHYRQKLMSISKQTANNRRQKYNNTRQSAHSEGKFQ